MSIRPLLGLVFASLADRWTQAGLPGNFEKRAVHEEAQTVLPLAWQGGTTRVTIKPRQEKLAFTGSSLTTCAPCRRILDDNSFCWRDSRSLSASGV